MELLDRRKNFGRWLRDCRKAANVTQSELALTLGYDSSQLISNIERGVSLLPSKKIPDFAKALGCSLLELEVRYFQCSARNNSESRMPDLLLKYLPLIEVLELGRGSPNEIMAAIAKVSGPQGSDQGQTGPIKKSQSENEFPKTTPQDADSTKPKFVSFGASF